MNNMRYRFVMAVRGITVSVCLCLIAAPALAAFSKNEIRELEDLLARLGFNPGPVDGVLDAQTRIAIRDYQEFAALPVAGWASQRLLDELRGVTESLGDVRIREAAAQAVAAPALSVFSKTEIRELEDFLAQLGFNPGPVDGVMDDQTRAAIKDYQGFASLPVTGRASRRLLNELRGVTESLGPATFEIALQLALFKTEVGARRGWAQMQRQLPDLLGDMNPRFPVVDLGDGGTYYQVVTGPFPNRATAADLCAMMTAEGQECRIIQSAPQQVAEATPPTQAAAEPASPAPATAPTKPAPTENPPKPAIGEPLAPSPAKPAVTQDEPVAAPLQLAEVETSAPSPESEAPPAKKAGLAPPLAPAPAAEPPEPAPEVQPSTGGEVTAPVPEEAVEEVATSPEETPEPATQTPATAYFSPNTSDAPLSQGGLARTVGLVGDLSFFFSKLADTDPNPLAREIWWVAAQAYTAGQGELDAALKQGRLRLSDEALEQAIQRRGDALVVAPHLAGDWAVPVANEAEGREDGWLVFANLATHLIGAWVDEEWAQGEAWFQRHETAAGLGTSAAEGRPRRADLARYWVFKDIFLRASLFRAATESPSQGGLWSVRQSQIEALLSVFLDRLAADVGPDWTARLRVDWAAYRADTDRLASERAWLLLAERRPEPAGLEGTARWPGRKPPLKANFGTKIHRE